MAKKSVTISFSTISGDDIDLTVDMDDVKNEDKDNGGSGRTSSFVFGDEAFFRVFPNPITGINIECFPSDGVLTSYEEGTAVYDHEEYLQFSEPYEAEGGKIEENTASLAFPASSGFIATAKSANSCGSVTLDPLDPSFALASATGPGVYEASYTANYWSFSIQMNSIPNDWPVDEPYPIVIVIVGSPA